MIILVFVVFWMGGPLGVHAQNGDEDTVVLVPLEDYDTSYFCTSSFSCELTAWGQDIDPPFVDVTTFKLPYNSQGKLKKLIEPIDQMVLDPEKARLQKVGDSANFSFSQERLVGLWLFDGDEILLSPILTDRVFNRAERPYVQGVYYPFNRTTELSFRYLDFWDRKYYLYAKLRCHGLVPSVYYTPPERNQTAAGSDWTVCQEGAHRMDLWRQNFYHRPRPVTFDPGQQRIRAVLMLFSGFVSMMASSFLVFAVVVRWSNNKRSTTRDRILLGMSLIDVNNSLGLVFGPILSPNDTIEVIWSRGNQALCTIQGYSIQLGFGVPIYNAMLCIFFLLVIAFQQDDSVIQNRFEWIFHLCAAGFALSSALAGIFLNLYNPNGTFCWIESGPYNCQSVDHVDCTRADDADMYRWAFAGYPIIASFGIIIVTMTWIYALVWYRGFVMKRRYGSANSRLAAMSRQTAVQASLFVMGVTITYVWGFIILSFQMRGFEQGFALHAANAFFLPLQGFWNLFIFIRLTFGKERKAHPDQSWLWALHRAMQKESIMYVLPRSNNPRGRRNFSRVLSQSFDSTQSDRRRILCRVFGRMPRGATLSGGGSSDEQISGELMDDSAAPTRIRNLSKLRDGHGDGKVEEEAVSSVAGLGESDKGPGETKTIGSGALTGTILPR